jgi:RNA polymerase sigma factor (TIGR02999 family)
MPADVTRLLQAWTAGDPGALDRLLPVVYDELRRLARARLRHEREGHTLGTTGLVHEAYLRLLDVERVRWHDRAHFLAMASTTMRRVLVDYAKARNALKRGGGVARVDLDSLPRDRGEALLSDEQAETVLDLDDALTRFEALAPRPARAVECRYFGGLSNEEAAAALDVSVATVERDLRYARAWLAREWKGDFAA